MLRKLGSPRQKKRSNEKNDDSGSFSFDLTGDGADVKGTEKKGKETSDLPQLKEEGKGEDEQKVIDSDPKTMAKDSTVIKTGPVAAITAPPEETHKERKAPKEKRKPTSKIRLTKKKGDQDTEHETEEPWQLEDKSKAPLQAHISTSPTRPEVKHQTSSMSLSLEPLRCQNSNMDTMDNNVKAKTNGQAVVPQDAMEMHVIGEIQSASGFGSGTYACKWHLNASLSPWQIVEGDALGQTQFDFISPLKRVLVWAHPIDTHLVSIVPPNTKLAAAWKWPTLLFEIVRLPDEASVAMGTVQVPFQSGMYSFQIDCWRLVGNLQQELAFMLFGARPPTLPFDFGAAENALEQLEQLRCRLQTIASGQVQLQLNLLLRNGWQ